MKKFIATLGLGALTLAAPALHAQGLPLTTLTGSELGLQLSSYRYEEDNNGAYFMSLEGRKLGVTGAFTQALTNGWHWGVDGRYASGNTDYDSAGTGRKSANPDYYLEGRVTLGRDLAAGAQVLSPYTGLGYRYLSNDLRGYTTTGAVGYRRISSYIYLPLGVTYRMRAGAQGRLVTTFEYDYLIEGTQRSYMSDVGYQRDLLNQQRSGHGLRLALAYEEADWSIGVFVHQWDIARSDVGTYTDATLVYTGIEPHNITREAGIQLKYHFR